MSSYHTETHHTHTSTILPFLFYINVKTDDLKKKGNPCEYTINTLTGSVPDRGTRGLQLTRLVPYGGDLCNQVYTYPCSSR